MTQKNRRFQTRKEHAELKDKKGTVGKLDRLLNGLIAIVSVLIIISLVIILRSQDEPESEAAQLSEENTEHVETPVEETDTSEQAEPKENVGMDEEEAENSQPESKPESKPEEQNAEATVASSEDPVVKEVLTNPNWEPYPTQQTGAHTSTYQKGHIDYEEMLGAIYSVTELDPQTSILWNLKNNGSANTAIAVLSSQDKETKYRVSIEWIDATGWKPVKVEVLESLEGSY